MTRLEQRLMELRTKEAMGGGTDPMLVLLEAIVVEGKLHALDEQVAQLAGGRRHRGLILALDESPDLQTALEDYWQGIELEEHTTRLREIDDLLNLLLPEGA